MCRCAVLLNSYDFHFLCVCVCVFRTHLLILGNFINFIRQIANAPKPKSSPYYNFYFQSFCIFVRSQTLCLVKSHL